MKKKIIIAVVLLMGLGGLLCFLLKPVPTKGNVDTFLKEIFTMPNDNVAAYYKDVDAGKIPGENIEKIIDDEFGQYLNEKGLKSFIARYCYVNAIATLSNDINASITPKDIKVVYDSNDYTFSLVLVVKDKDYKISGSGRLNNNNKIEYFDIDIPSLKTIEEIRNIN